MTHESTEIRMKRLRMRSWHRGIKEMDMILGTYADTALADLAPELLDIYEHLLDENDHDLYGWFSGRIAMPDRFDALMNIIRNNAELLNQH